jgi:hypothetical protein
LFQNEPTIIKLAKKIMIDSKRVIISSKLNVLDKGISNTIIVIIIAVTPSEKKSNLSLEYAILIKPLF